MLPELSETSNQTGVAIAMGHMVSGDAQREYIQHRDRQLSRSIVITQIRMMKIVIERLTDQMFQSKVGK